MLLLSHCTRRPSSTGSVWNHTVETNKTRRYERIGSANVEERPTQACCIYKSGASVGRAQSAEAFQSTVAQ